VLYLIDYEQRTLVPLGDPAHEDLRPLSVEGTIAGRAFRTTSVLRSSSEAGIGERLWLPLLDGTERLGVIQMAFDHEPIPERTATVCERYAHLTAMLIATKAAYGDTFEVPRRREPMTIASELLWQLAPPLVFATDRLVLAGMLEPCYDNGGDALDYAVNDGVLHVGIFDAMGHGLPAAGVAAFALSAYRHSRRRGCGPLETYASMDAAVRDQFPGDRYVTAVIAQLHLETGRLTWVSAGHPPPLVIRHARLARTLSAPPAAPLGIPLDGPPAELAEESFGARGPLVALHRWTDRGASAQRRDVHGPRSRRVHRARGRRRADRSRDAAPAAPGHRRAPAGTAQGRCHGGARRVAQRQRGGPAAPHGPASRLTGAI
jgi:hypothetical protein